MKKITRFYSLFFLILSTSPFFAQPANDNACDALELTLNAPAITLSNIGASTQTGEQVLVPPGSSDCKLGTWCDTSGPMGGPAIDHSLWFRFTTPINTDYGIAIDLCNSTFNTQVALYRFTDCADFSTYEYIWASDDQIGCGLSSTLTKACLEMGREYLVVVDDWQAIPGQAIDSGEVIIAIDTYINDFPGVAISNDPLIKSPLCPGGDQGIIDITLIDGELPINYQWSNGAITQDISGLIAGIYTVTITDFCGDSLVTVFDLEDPSVPTPQIIFKQHDLEVTHPIRCGSGAQGGQIIPLLEQGVAPFSYLWSTGDTTSILNNLPDGVYSLTITDFCGIQTVEKTYYLGLTAGPDIETYCFPDFPQIGIDHSQTGGAFTRFACNTDTTLYPAGACRDGDFIGRSALWKSFDLANDFGVSTEVNLAGFEIFVQSIPNPLKASTIPIKASLYVVSTPLLDDNNLQAIFLDSLETTVPAIYDFIPYFLPLKAEGLGPNDVLALKIETLTSSSDGHIFGLGANDTPTSRPTYWTSDDCAILSPMALPDAGFDDYVVMDILLKDPIPGGLTYQWDGPISDPTSATPLAQSLDNVTTYTVTITDVACGITVVDEVTVTCLTDATDDQKPRSFSIFPNPNNGFFQIKNEGAERSVGVAVYNLQGCLLRQEQRQVSANGSQSLDFSDLVEGIYFIHLETEFTTELHRFVVQSLH